MTMRQRIPRQRLTKWAVIAVVAVAVFGAMYYALRTIAGFREGTKPRHSEFVDARCSSRLE